MEIETSRHDWKKALGRVVNSAEFAGMPDKTINEIANRLGNFFAGSYDPGNREQRLLKELWELADEDEKRSLAKVIVKLTENDIKQ